MEASDPRYREYRKRMATLNGEEAAGNAVAATPGTSGVDPKRARSTWVGGTQQAQQFANTQVPNDL